MSIATIIAILTGTAAAAIAAAAAATPRPQPRPVPVKARKGRPIAGAVLGRSLYAGTIKPAEALAVAGGRRA